MNADIMLKEDNRLLAGSEPGLDAAEFIENSENSKALMLHQNSAIIGNTARAKTGIIMSQRTDVDIQQLNDLRIQLELSAQVASICKRMR